MKLKLILLLISFSFFSGCGDDQLFDLNPDDQVTSFSIPSDESTSEQREAIDKTLSKLEEYAKSFGGDGNYRRIPILVRQSTPMDYGLNGTCNFDGRGTARFIVIYSDVFNKDKRDPNPSLASNLFVVLLHEIGHCYHSRSHENQYIEDPGYEIYMDHHSFMKVASTVMVLAPNDFFPRKLESYYVGEILGQHRANNPDELRPFARFYLYPLYDRGLSPIAPPAPGGGDSHPPVDDTGDGTGSAEEVPPETPDNAERPPENNGESGGNESGESDEDSSSGDENEESAEDSDDEDDDDGGIFDWFSLIKLNFNA